MSTTISIRLVWGRFHANPWNRSNNEGVAEWPPSPWRFLRALYSSWKVNHPELSAESVIPVLDALREPPRFVLPQYREGHLRHYMPGSRHLHGVNTETAKTLDPFIVTAKDAPVWVEWQCDLRPDQREILEELCAGVRYLGRAESLVECTLTSEVGVGFKCNPVDDEATGVVRVLVPDGPLSEAGLTQTGTALRRDRRLQPLGTRYQPYTRPTPKLSISVGRTPPRRGRPTAVRLALAGDVQPSRYQAVSVGHQLHRASVAKHGTPSSTLSGRDSAGQPLAGEHQHAHFLAMPELTDLSGRRVSSVIVWAPTGFTDSEVAALESIKRLSGLPHGGLSSQRCAVLAVGDISSVAPELVGAAGVWRSVTPYSPIHHHRGELTERLRKDVAKELGHRGLPTLRGLQVLDGGWLQYRRYRPGKERINNGRPAYGLRIEFEEPVLGPLALGQLSHFGLGLFQPDQP